jgi:hypothetical protein
MRRDGSQVPGDGWWMMDDEVEMLRLDETLGSRDQW